MRVCEGQVVIVTGAGRGIGRAHALMFAKHGAKVVVNDMGVAYGGGTGSSGPADAVTAEIVAAGGQAIASTEDITDEAAAGRIVQAAIDTFGDLHTVVNNAGIIRRKSIFETTSADMVEVYAVHVLGSFHLTKHAVAYWRPRIEAGEQLNVSIINSTSVNGLTPFDPAIGVELFGVNTAHLAYVTAKMGVAAFTIATSYDLLPFGIRVNCIAPTGRTRLTDESVIDLGGRVLPSAAKDGFDPFAPETNSPLVVWLSSPEAADISGRVFTTGASISVARGWTFGRSEPQDRLFDPSELGPIVRRLLAEEDF